MTCATKTNFSEHNCMTDAANNNSQYSEKRGKRHADIRKVSDTPSDSTWQLYQIHQR